MTEPAPAAARFLHGPLLGHVVRMAGSGAVGLVAVFAVDLINLFYIAQLDDAANTAAVGFTGVLGFFHTSVSIGLMIGVSATVARLIGAGQMQQAGRAATHALLASVVAGTALALLTLALLDPMLHLLGARGQAAELAAAYLRISVMSLPLQMVGMSCTALLRSMGDARRSMNVTLGAAAVTAALDPLLIFGLGLGLPGAAVTAVLARAALCGIGLHGVTRVHRLLSAPQKQGWREDLRTLSGVAGPAVLTNLAPPVGVAYVTHAVAQFGSEAVTGQATIERIAPVAFGLIYSLSGAVGPILAQNLGAGRYDRVQETLRASLGFMAAAVLGAWLLLALAQDFLVQAFGLQGLSATMVHAFCSWFAGGFLFAGALFVANAAFNNLGRPLWSTGFNWVRATLGTLPFVWWGARYGPLGILAGQLLGTGLVGIAALVTAFLLARKLQNEQTDGT